MECPKCGAESGKSCWENNKFRQANHQERMNAYRVKFMDGVGVIGPKKKEGVVWVTRRTIKS